MQFKRHSESYMSHPGYTFWATQVKEQQPRSKHAPKLEGSEPKSEKASRRDALRFKFNLKASSFHSR